MKKYLAAFFTLIGVNQHLTAEQKHDLASSAVSATPGAVAAGISKAWDMTPANLLVYISIGFVILQAAHLIWKWRRQSKIDSNRALHGLPPESTGFGKL